MSLFSDHYESSIPEFVREVHPTEWMCFTSLSCLVNISQSAYLEYDSEHYVNASLTPLTLPVFPCMHQVIICSYKDRLPPRSPEELRDIAMTTWHQTNHDQKLV
jgi:hypothetical protein